MSISFLAGWQPDSRLKGQIGWVGLRVGGHLALSLHSSNEPGELLHWPCHHESTINIVVSVSIIRLHRSTTYVDATYCYRPTSVVCQSVCLSVSLSVSQSVTLVSYAKMAEPFGLGTWIGPKNHVLDGVQHLSMGRRNYEGEGATHCKV